MANLIYKIKTIKNSKNAEGEGDGEGGDNTNP